MPVLSETRRKVGVSGFLSDRLYQAVPFTADRKPSVRNVPENRSVPPDDDSRFDHGLHEIHREMIGEVFISGAVEDDDIRLLS